MPNDGVTRGFDGLDRALARLPNVLATELQGTIVRQMIAAKKRITATSTMRDKRPLRAPKDEGIVKIIPTERVRPRRIRDVSAELFSTWRGGEGLGKQEAAAFVIEEEVGPQVYRPKRRRGLLIPAGVLLTRSGRPKKKGGKPIDPATIPGTRWVRTKRGVLLVREKATKTGKKRRTEIVGSLLQEAKPTAELRFFASWDDLAPQRTRQYGRMLERVLRRI